MPAKLDIEPDNTYYIQLITSRSNDPKFGGSAPIIPAIVGDVTLYVEGGIPQSYSSSFMRQDKQHWRMFYDW